MIKLEQLLVEGGLSFQAQTIFPLADQGLTKLVGLNQDEFAGSSNGSGKSSISDLLTHIIFATTAKGLKKNEIVCDLSPTGFYGRLDFNTGSHNYQIHQSRQHKDHGTSVKLVEDGVDKKIKGINETQEAARLAVGLTLDEWLATTYMGQKHKHIFVRPNENDAKKKLLARVFNLQYQQFQAAAEAKLKAVKEALLTLKGSITASKKDLEERLAKYAKTPEQYGAEIASIELEIGRLNRSTAELRADVRAYELARVSQDRKDQQAKVVEAALINAGLWGGSVPSSATFRDQILEADAEILKMEASLKEYRDTVRTLQTRDQLKAAFHAIDQSTPEGCKVPLDLNQSHQITQQLAQLKAIQPQWFADRATAIERLASLTEDYDQLITDGSAELAKLTGEIARVTAEQAGASKLLVGASQGTCSSCGQSIPVELVQKYQQTVEALQAELADLNAKAQHLRTVGGLHAQCKQAKKQLQDALVVYGQHLDGWTPESLQAELGRVEAEVAQNQNHNAAYLAWNGAKQHYDAYADFESYAASTYEAAVVTQEGELAKVRAKRDINQSLKSSVEAYEIIVVPPAKVVDTLQVNGQVTQQTEDATRLGEQKVSLEKELEVLNDILAQIAATKDKEAEILVLERKEAINSSLVYTFGPKGLLVERLETICDYMNDRCNAALSKIMRDNVQLKFYMDEDSIDLDIMMNGKTRGVANLSGGEENKVGLACLLGLRSLIPDTHQVNVLIADEIDASWDDYVRAEMVELYQEMLRNTSLDTILVVTHSVPTRELPVWQTTWNVTKRDGVSTLEIQ